MSDRMREAREWNQYIDAVAREIEEEKAAKATQQPVDEGPLPLVVDRGPGLNSPRTERAVQRYEDRITELDRMGR